MKKRLFVLLLTLTALLCVLPASAQEETASAEVEVSTNAADLILNDNETKNYVMGNGMNHEPAKSFLYANEKGGVTLVQYIHAKRHIAVAEYDRELDFLNCRYFPVDEDIQNWGGFCAGAEYYYIAYRVWSPINSAILRVEQYDRNWTPVKAGEVVCSGAGSIINNDFDMVESGGLLHIITNQIFNSGSGRGHQANMHLELDADSLEKTMQHISVSDYPGYTSHSYMPEVVASGNMLYTFDRSDTYPSPGLFVTSFNGSFSNGGTMTGPYAWGGDWRDWGSPGNAIPAPGNQALLAYNAGIYFNNSIPDNCDVYLYHTGSGVKKLEGSTGSGTPYVGAISGSSGFVLWNPDLYMAARNDLPDDDLYYAPYVINSGSLTVGNVLKAEGHALSDCEPITFDGGLLWFTVEGGELTFHQLKANQEPTKKIAHRYAPVERKEPTCTEPGWTEGTRCELCGEMGGGMEELPILPHTEKTIPARAPTCSSVGLTEGKQCSVCYITLQEQKTIPALPHTEAVLNGYPATCGSAGHTDGIYCSVCQLTLTRWEEIPPLGHVEVPYPGYAPTCWQEGRTDGTRCDRCHTVMSGRDTIPKLEHIPVEYPAIEPGVDSFGKTPEVRCSLCDGYISGGDSIPVAAFLVTGQRIEDGKLILSYRRIFDFYLVFTLWDDEGRLLGIKTNFDLRRPGTEEIALDLVEGAVYYRAFSLEREQTQYENLYGPAREVREGLIEYPT